MAFDMILLHSSFDPVRVELSSSDTKDVRTWYFTDLIEADGGRAGVWDGQNLGKARYTGCKCADIGGSNSSLL